MVGYAGFVVARAWVKSECAGAEREKRGRGAGVRPARDPAARAAAPPGAGRAGVRAGSPGSGPSRGGGGSAGACP